MSAMQPGLSTYVFLPQRLHPGLLDSLHRAGAAVIEVVAARHHFDYTDRGAIRDLASWFSDTGVTPTLHQPLYLTDRADTQWSRHVSPNLSLIDPEKSRRIAAMDEVKRALESAEGIPFRAITLHLGLKDDRWSPRSLEHSLTAIEHIGAFARALGVQVLLENLQNEIATPEHLLEILRVGHFDSVGITLDLGHALLPLPDAPAPGIEASLELLRPRIAQVDLHTNAGTADDHLWPTVDGDPADASASAANPASPNPAPASTRSASSPDPSATRTARPATWSATLGLLNTLPAQTPGIFEIAHDPSRTPATLTSEARRQFDTLNREADRSALAQPTT